MQVFSEESNAPLNDWPRDLRPATVFHAAACFVRALDVDPECIVFALVLLERLGIELLRVLLTPSTWRNVLISTLALATKVWYDESVHLHDVHERLLPYGYNTGDLPRQELLLVKLVQYDVAFSSSTYFSYMYPMLSIRPSSDAMRIFEEISVLLEDTTSTEDCKSAGEALAWHC